MQVILNDNREFRRSTVYVGFEGENKAGVLEFVFPDYLNELNKKLCFETTDGKRFTKTFDNIISNNFTLTRDIMAYKQIKCSVEFFKKDNEDDIVYKTSNLTLIILPSIQSGDIQISPEETKVINDLIAVLEDNIEQADNLNIEIKKENNVTSVSITKKDGSVENTKIYDGEKGDPGFSPVVTTETIDNGVQIKITTQQGDIVAEVYNGQDGKDGYTPIKGKDYFDGIDGKDGYTPIKGKDYFDGKDGVNGKDGYTPVKGVDYFDGKDGKDYTITEEDYQEIGTIVEANIQPTLNNNLKEAKDYTDNAIVKDFKDISYDEKTATITFTRHDNTTFTIDLPIEQTVKDGRYDNTTNELILILVSGQEIKIPVTGLIDDYDGVDSATIQCVVSADNKITCNIIGGSITKTLLTTELQEEINNKLEQSDLANYIKDTDYATSSKAGLLRPANGLFTSGNTGALLISKASNDQIDKKTDNYYPIVPSNLNYAVGSVKASETQSGTVKVWISTNDDGETGLNISTEV